MSFFSLQNKPPVWRRVVNIVADWNGGARLSAPFNVTATERGYVAGRFRVDPSGPSMTIQNGLTYTGSVCLDCGQRSPGGTSVLTEIDKAMRFLETHECPELGGGA